MKDAVKDAAGTVESEPKTRRCKVCLMNFRPGETEHPECDPALKAPGKRAITAESAARKKADKAFSQETRFGLHCGLESDTKMAAKRAAKDACAATTSTKPKCFGCNKSLRKYADGLCEKCHRIAVAATDAVKAADITTNVDKAKATGPA